MDYHPNNTQAIFDISTEYKLYFGEDIT